MRKLFPLAFALLLAAAPAAAQQPVTPTDLDGTWQLNFDIDMSEADGPIERIALKAVLGLLDEVDVRFGFQEDSRLRVMVDAMGDKEEEYSEWWITDRGGLVLGSTGPVEFDTDDTMWMKTEDGLLWAYEPLASGEAGARKGMYLTRMGG